MTTTTTNRLEEIAERQTRSRIIDIAFAAMVALFLTLAVLSLRSATARAEASTAAPAVTQPADAHASSATCALDAAC